MTHGAPDIAALMRRGTRLRRRRQLAVSAGVGLAAAAVVAPFLLLGGGADEATDLAPADRPAASTGAATPTPTPTPSRQHGLAEVARRAELDATPGLRRRGLPRQPGHRRVRREGRADRDPARDGHLRRDDRGALRRPQEGLRHGHRQAQGQRRRDLGRHHGGRTARADGLGLPARRGGVARTGLPVRRPAHHRRGRLAAVRDVRADRGRAPGGRRDRRRPVTTGGRREHHGLPRLHRVLRHRGLGRELGGDRADITYGVPGGPSCSIATCGMSVDLVRPGSFDA